MKIVITLLFSAFLLTLISCNPPRDRRVAFSGGSTENTNPFTDGINDTTLIESTPTPVPSETSTSTTGTIPTDIPSTCTFSTDGNSGYKSYNAHVGKFTLCQSTTDAKKLYIQVQTPITANRLCLIPTYGNQSGSFYIGEPRCLFIYNAKTIYSLSLNINRINYTNITPNSVMMMKDEAHNYGPPFGYPYQSLLSPDAYLFCSNWMATHYGDTSYCQAFNAVGAFVFYTFY
ncbi:MAG: hypothetical protein A2504_15070 [Bdellovibrionales bacterium RIFOXYD12_FULL_39_22]|nr:MAG: hypothetical protein A2385_02500 [Bdellovibrionales bacterium RIFOXYB1_FULL_39_21]OFZ43117.1 MAG: hypothetical protein A2485_11645 [Bdellovibrionales bacterium RIFOXYC12_FULL_39_17]OFZ47855.1 MAG: hypothetical protein A2404_16285 [Bdellovibrionales bacterium RIFOXYC1_FULL_39_130]OFZ75635.1 MAG: hypothetical protein A2560_12785 [Bdellovibrionales bacterium RIFOXYD1_FULL_39_84]OFZ94125.1 MAG: hypothetical protein A2504_15070 [Bdellovibrionales bacterium RIFOXYD12_FULL_39_22]HLE11810.1 hy